MVRAISENDSPNPTIVTFTTTTATQMLPLVRRIVDDLLSLDRAIKAQKEQILGIDQLGSTIDQPDYQEELSDIRGSLDSAERRFDSFLSELTSLGVSPHLPFDGTVDFPTVVNRRQARLCWQPGEEKVEYWHEIGVGKDQRRKLEDPVRG